MSQIHKEMLNLIREIQIKTTWIYYCSSLKLAKVKNLPMSSKIVNAYPTDMEVFPGFIFKWKKQVKLWSILYATFSVRKREKDIFVSALFAYRNTKDT